MVNITSFFNTIHTEEVGEICIGGMRFPKTWFTGGKSTLLFIRTIMARCSVVVAWLIQITPVVSAKTVKLHSFSFIQPLKNPGNKVSHILLTEGILRN